MDFKKLLHYVEDHKVEHLSKTIAENKRKTVERAARAKEKKKEFLVYANTK